jgi:hypothetical protein
MILRCPFNAGQESRRSPSPTLEPSEDALLIEKLKGEVEQVRCYACRKHSINIFNSQLKKDKEEEKKVLAEKMADIRSLQKSHEDLKKTLRSYQIKQRIERELQEERHHETLKVRQIINVCGNCISSVWGPIVLWCEGYSERPLEFANIFFSLC